MEYEAVLPLASVREIHRVAWDALGQSVVVVAGVGQEGAPLRSAAVALTPPAALQLLLELGECLSGTAPEELPEQ